MNKRILVGLIAVSLLVFACEDKEGLAPPQEEGPKPMAGFSYTQVSEDDPFTFSFTNESENFVVSRWEFGDDSTSVLESPTHTFLGAGRFNVMLRTENSEGYWAQKELIIEISADSLVQLKTSPAQPGFLSLSYDALLPFEEIFWYKVDGDNGELAGQDPMLEIPVESGRLDEYWFMGVTAKGSRVLIREQVTDLGLVADVTDNASFSVSRDNSGGKEAGEGSLKLIDNNINTKFLQFDYTGDLWCRLDFYDPVIIGGYSMTSANDADGRDPLNWTLEGSDDGIIWVTVDTREGEDFPDRFQTRTFLFNNSIPYQSYRLNITDINSGSLFQLAEWRMLSFRN